MGKQPKMAHWNSPNHAPYNHYGPWERLSTFQTIWLFGKRWRRADYTRGGYQYQTERQRAYNELAKQFDANYPPERIVYPREIAEGTDQAQQAPTTQSTRRAKI